MIFHRKITGSGRSAAILFAVWLAVFAFCRMACAAGPVLTQVHDLNFGIFGMHDNKYVHTVTVAPDGTLTADSAFVFATQPQNAEYRLTGLPANEVLSITFANSDTMAPQVTSSPLFTVKDYRSNSPLTTDGSGAVTLLVGATMQTSGAGPYYQTDQYIGNFDLTILY